MLKSINLIESRLTELVEQVKYNEYQLKNSFNLEYKERIKYNLKMLWQNIDMLLDKFNEK